MPVGIRLAVGWIVDSQPAKDDTPMGKLMHRVNVPIVGAKLELRQPLSGAVYKTVSDSTGHFRFDDVAQGLYVLHMDTDSASNDQVFDSADVLIRLSRSAKLETLLLTTRDGVSGRRHLGIEVSQIPN